MRRFVFGARMATFASLPALGIVELGFFALVKSRLFHPNVDGLYAVSRGLVYRLARSRCPANESIAIPTVGIVVFFRGFSPSGDGG